MPGSVRSPQDDPYLSYNFLVEIQGLTVGGFSDVTGLQVEMQTEDYVEGGRNGYVHKLAGPVRYPGNLILKRGIMDEDELWDWLHTVVSGAVTRRTVWIVLRDSARDEVRRWGFKNAYPIKWSGPELRASSNAVAIESVELAHEGFEELP